MPDRVVGSHLGGEIPTTAMPHTNKLPFNCLFVADDVGLQVGFFPSSVGAVGAGVVGVHMDFLVS